MWSFSVILLLKLLDVIMRKQCVAIMEIPCLRNFPLIPPTIGPMWSLKIENIHSRSLALGLYNLMWGTKRFSQA